MRNWLRALIMAVALASAPALAEFHLFQIEQIYSNASGTIQFIVLQETGGANGEHRWANHAITSTHSGSTRVLNFTTNLPSSETANKRVLIATQGFADLDLIKPDYKMPNNFVGINGGTLNYAGVNQWSYGVMPIDGTNALARNGAIIPNLATNFAGISASVGATTFIPVSGIWANTNEIGTGYALEFRHGILVVAIYTYLASGAAQWYLASGPVVNNVFTQTLDKYTNGQCISCAYTGPPTLTGNDGNVTITFTSPTSATVNLPGGRVTTITPFLF